MATTLPTRISRTLEPFFDRDPLRALRREMDDLMRRFSLEWDEDWLPAEFHPSLDISETDEMMEVRMDLPGVKPEDVDIEIRGNLLRVTGERKEEREEKGRTWHRLERSVGKFARSVTLPCSVQEEKVEAEYRDGVLLIKLPKTEEAKTHKITVKASK